MQNPVEVSGEALAEARVRLAADVECPRCGEVSCAWQECREG